MHFEDEIEGRYFGGMHFGECILGNIFKENLITRQANIPEDKIVL